MDCFGEAWLLLDFLVESRIGLSHGQRTPENKNKCMMDETMDDGTVY